MKKLICLLAIIFLTIIAEGYDIDVNYFEHGLVNVNGKIVSTKKFSYLTTGWLDWQTHGAEADFYDKIKFYRDNTYAGERIDNYLFRLGTDCTLYVTDLRSSTVKRVKVAHASQLNGSMIYTVLRGYKSNTWNSVYFTFMDVVDPIHIFHNHRDKYQRLTYPSYHLLVKNNHEQIDYYDINVYGAFEAGEDLKLEFIATDDGYRNRGGLISLIRVPSLDASPTPLIFDNQDCVITVNGIANDNMVVVSTLQFDPSKNIDGKAYHDVSTYSPYVHWDKKHYGPLKIIDSVSATTRIGPDGSYVVCIGFNCWDRLGKKQEHFNAVRMIEYYVGFDNGVYFIKYAGMQSDITICKNETFYTGHYGMVSTYNNPTSSFQANQTLAFILPGLSVSGDKWVLFDVAKGGIVDWDPLKLKAAGIDPSITSGIDSATGEGMLVQGMILCVPPHQVPEAEKDKVVSTVTVNKTAEEYSYEGETHKFSNKTTVELGGIRAFPSVATGTSYEFANTSTEETSKNIAQGGSYTLSDYSCNMWVGIMPDWKIVPALLSGRHGEPVKYFNMVMPEPKPYVLMSAIYGPDSAVVRRLGLTESPGEGKDGEIFITRGMAPYSASDIVSIQKICGTLRNLANMATKDKDEYVKVLSKSVSTIDNQGGPSSTWFNISEASKFDYATTNTVTVTAKIGAKDKFSIGNDSVSSITKTHGTKTTDSQGWVCAFTGTKYLAPTQKYEMRVVMYQISVKKLKAKFGTRTGEHDLTFIPDYLWNNDIDYWLLAYDNINPVNMF